MGLVTEIKCVALGLLLVLPYFLATLGAAWLAVRLHDAHQAIDGPTPKQVHTPPPGDSHEQN